MKHSTVPFHIIHEACQHTGIPHTGNTQVTGMLGAVRCQHRLSVPMPQKHIVWNDTYLPIPPPGNYTTVNMTHAPRFVKCCIYLSVHPSTLPSPILPSIFPSINPSFHAITYPYRILYKYNISYIGTMSGTDYWLVWFLVTYIIFFFDRT